MNKKNKECESEIKESIQVTEEIAEPEKIDEILNVSGSQDAIESNDFETEEMLKENKEEKSANTMEAKNAECVKPQKGKFYAHPAFLAAAFILSIALVFITIVAIVTSTKGVTVKELFGIKGKRLDFKKDDLDTYINIEEDDYKNYEIKLNIPEPTYELDVQNHIINLLYKNKKGVLYGGDHQYSTSEKTNLIKAGDKVYIYYAGYEIDAEGQRHEISSLTNYGDVNEAAYYTENKDPDPVFIGEMSDIFAPGFELALIGHSTIVKNSENYNSNIFDAKFNGKVMPGEVVYLCLTYVDEHGILHDRENVRIDLRDENVEKIWGEGVYEDLLRQTNLSQTWSNDRVDLRTATGKRIYTYMRINYTTTCETENNVTTVKVEYPYDWKDESLRGKTVYFDVFLEKSAHYEVPEFNDSFVTDILKISSEELAAFEGSNLVEKYKFYCMDNLLKEYKAECNSMAEKRLWERLKDKIEFKELPQDEYVAAYETRYYSYKNEYENLQQGENPYYKELDEYIADCLELGEEDDVGEALRADVKDGIFEKLIVYAFLRKENLLPETEEEYDVIYRNELSLDYEYYLDGCKSRREEPVYKTIDEYETFINAYYGVAGYEDFVYYSYATSKMLEMATIVY